MLSKCINSVLNQTFKNYEIIIVDDGSGNEIADYCDKLSHDNKVIKVIHQENTGLGGARNTGIINASGEWLIHIDSDDWIDNDLLEKVFISIQNSTKVDILYWGYTAWQKDHYSKKLLKDNSVSRLSYALQKNEVIKAVMLNSKAYNYVALNTTWAKAYRTKFIKDNNLLFNTSLRRAQDVIYNLYAFEKASNIGYVDTAGSNYRIDNQSLSRGYNPKTFERMTRTANACIDFCNEYPENQEYKIAGYDFCRTCYRIITKQDFANSGNSESLVVKKKRFKEGLNLEPYKTAFERIKERKDNSSFDIKLIAKGHFYSLLMYWNIRATIRKIFKRN